MVCASHPEMGLGLCSNAGVCENGICICDVGWNRAAPIAYPAPGTNCTEHTLTLLLCNIFFLFSGIVHLMFCALELAHHQRIKRARNKRTRTSTHSSWKPAFFRLPEQARFIKKSRISTIYVWGISYALCSIILPTIHFIDPALQGHGVREVALFFWGLACCSAFMQALNIVRNVLVLLGAMSVWGKESKMALSLIKKAKRVLIPAAWITYSTLLPPIVLMFRPGEAWAFIWWCLNGVLLCWLYGGLFVAVGVKVRRLLSQVMHTTPVTSNAASLQRVHRNFTRMIWIAGLSGFALGAFYAVPAVWDFPRARASYLIAVSLGLANLMLMLVMWFGFGQAIHNRSYRATSNKPGGDQGTLLRGHTADVSSNKDTHKGGLRGLVLSISQGGSEEGGLVSISQDGPETLNIRGVNDIKCTEVQENERDTKKERDLEIEDSGAKLLHSYRTDNQQKFKDWRKQEKDRG
eukprot:g73890.t1